LLAYSRQRSQRQAKTTQTDKTLKLMVFKKVVGLFMVVVMMASTTLSVAKVMWKKSAQNGNQTQEWIFDGSDPLDPAHYQQNDTGESLEDMCDGGTTLCGVIAPEGSEGPDLSDPGLRNRIQNPGNYSDVFFQP